VVRVVLVEVAKNPLDVVSPVHEFLLEVSKPLANRGVV